MAAQSSSLLKMFDALRSGRCIHPQSPPQARSRYRGANWVASHVFSFLDGESFCQSTMASTEFYALTTQKINLPLQVLEQNIATVRYGSYTIKKTIDRKLAEEVLKQTGFEIVIPPGKNTISNFYIGHGEGSGGHIYLGVEQRTGDYVAVKVTNGNRNIVREDEILKALQNRPHILPRRGHHVESLGHNRLRLYQFLELEGLGSAQHLKHLIQSIQDTQFRDQLLFCFAQGLLQGLKTIHEAGFCHLDIKPDNLMVNQNGSGFLIDFGCSTRTPNRTIQARKENGDKFYFSPERFIAENPLCLDVIDGQKVDAWAAGLTLLELADRAEFPFSDMEFHYHGSTQEEVTNRIKQFVQNQMPNIAVLQNVDPKGFWSLVLGLLHFDPAQRCTPADALTHPWYQKMEASSGKWKKNTEECFRELVQSLQREKRRRVTIAMRPDCIAVSPQELPLPHFSNFVERPDVQEKILNSLSRDCSSKTQITVCQGSGGVGKTELVNFIVHRKIIQERFGLILWFNSAENKNLIEAQYLALAQEFELVSRNANANANFADVLKKLAARLEYYQKSMNKPWLIVFDNAESEASINACLPKAGGHVLVTSRLKTWKDAIPIDVLSPDAAFKLVCNLLQNMDSENHKLCQALGYLPLALVQACAYLRNQRISIQDYIAVLQKATQAAAVLESDERFRGKKLPSSISGIWGVTLATLSKQHAEALNILNMLAYLSPDGIPQKLLKHLCSEEIIKLLQNYALLQFNENDQQYTQHRLLQLAIRSKHTPEQTRDILVALMTILNKMYLFHPGSVHERMGNHLLFKTGEMLMSHCESVASPPRQFKILYCEMHRWFAHLQGKMGQHQKWQELLLKALSINEECYGKKGNERAILLNDLGSAWGVLRNHEKSVECYREAISMLDKGDLKMVMEIEAYVCNNLGYAYRNLKKKEDAISYYEKAMKLYQERFGRIHFMVHKNLCDLGAMYGMLNNLQKSAEYFEQALLINEARATDSPRELAKKRFELAKDWLGTKNKKKAAESSELALKFAKQGNLKEDDSLLNKINDLMLQIEGKPAQQPAAQQSGQQSAQQPKQSPKSPAKR